MENIKTFRNSIKSELKQITWPSRKELSDKTFVVITMSAILAAIVFAADFAGAIGFQILLQIGT